MTIDLLAGLNEPQQEAVQHKDGPLLVLAGPGSGKTRVVTHRIAWLIRQHGVRSIHIAALTFTNKAATEMKSRLESIVPGNRVWLGTFHRFCSYLLRSFAPLVGLSQNFTIYDTDQSKQILESVVDKKNLPNGVDINKISSAIGWAKNAMVLPTDYVPREGNLVGQVVESVYPKYQEALKKANGVDFDDLLLHIAVLLKENADIRKRLDERFQYILVDEYQDTNLVQYAIASALSIDYRNLSVTGDPDQSIYGWRGADVKNILNFEKDFKDAKIIRLEQNYRSTQRILDAASELIKHNFFRKEKDLFTDNPPGIPPRDLRCFNQQEEAETIASEIAQEIRSGKRRPSDYAIFYRMNALSRNLEHALRKFQVPFQLVRGLEFFGRKEIKDLIAYLRLIYNSDDPISFLRVINLPTRGIGRTSLQKLGAFANENGISMLDAARNVDKLSTVSPKIKKSILQFTAMIDRLKDAAQKCDLEVLLTMLLDETKYLNVFRESDTEEDKQRLANVQELLSEVRDFDKSFNEENSLNNSKIDNSQSENDDVQSDETEDDSLPEEPQISRLGRFLEQTALVSDVDAWEDQAECVSLMTLHAAKGLEFPVVYIVAVEENILPHERSVDNKMQLEEERRLLFVGMTRAKEELRISRTQYREYRGMYTSTIFSRFLYEIPPQNVLRFDSPDEWTAFAEAVAQQSKSQTLENGDSSDKSESAHTGNLNSINNENLQQKNADISTNSDPNVKKTKCRSRRSVKTSEQTLGKKSEIKSPKKSEKTAEKTADAEQMLMERKLQEQSARQARSGLNGIRPSVRGAEDSVRVEYDPKAIARSNQDYIEPAVDYDDIQLDHSSLDDVSFDSGSFDGTFDDGAFDDRVSTNETSLNRRSQSDDFEHFCSERHSSSFLDNETESSELFFDRDGNLTGGAKKQNARIGADSVRRKTFISPDAVKTGLALSQEVEQIVRQNQNQQKENQQKKSSPSGSNNRSRSEDSISMQKLEPGMLVRHIHYGIGVVKDLLGPQDAQIVLIDFFSGIGQVDLQLPDRRLSVISRRKKE